MEEPDDILIDAKLSKASYNPSIKDVDGWKRDDQLSNENRAVYTKDGKARLAFTGTNFKKPRWYEDVGADLLLGLGLQDKSSRFRNAKKTAELAKQKYGAKNLSLTGHSLGGSQAMAVSRATGLKGTGFNTGAGPIDALRKRTYSNFKNFTADGDLISHFGRGIKRTTNIRVKPKKRTPTLCLIFSKFISSHRNKYEFKRSTEKPACILKFQVWNKEQRHVCVRCPVFTFQCNPKAQRHYSVCKGPTIHLSSVVL